MSELEVLNLTQKRQEMLNSRNIFTTEDILRYEPMRYFDYTNVIYDFAKITDGEHQNIYGKVIDVSTNSFKRYVRVKISDTFNNIFYAYWFGNTYVASSFIRGENYSFCGKVSFSDFTKCFQMSNPIFSNNLEESKKIIPQYRKIHGMSDDYFKKLIETILSEELYIDTTDTYLLNKFEVPSLKDMAKCLHFPKSLKDIEYAKKRVLFDELYKLAFCMKKNSYSVKQDSNINCKDMSAVPILLNSLPFNLTDGEDSQLSTIRSIIKKINKGKQTYSLVQGDVGSGKTFVALILMLIMAQNGYQSVLLAPTTVLAEQHMKEVQERLSQFDFIKPVLLTSNTKGKKQILKKIANNEYNFIIGTHAVLSDAIDFFNLGLYIVDEEHKFGVEQREKIKNKSQTGINTVIMSATPIPRTLGIFLYGDDVDIYQITKLPEGRHPIKTKIIKTTTPAYKFIEKEIKDGHQAYVVCPIITDSESEKMSDVDSVISTEKEMKAFYKDPSIRICSINGKMKQEEIDAIISDFKDKKYDILISTTIIEVGINIPNATVILIKNAERFGYSQLHQLRGRVGRSTLQSYCILTADEKYQQRLKILEESNDGFKIANADLKNRGIGNLIGLEQSGHFTNVALMLENQQLYKAIKNEVDNMFKTVNQYNKLINNFK